MKTKTKRIIMIILLAIAFYLSEKLFTAFLVFNWMIEEIQKKRGYKDKGEKKYDMEELIRFAMTIPKYTILHGPEVKKLFPNLSKDHIYKIIEMRKAINKKNPEAPNFWEIHRKMLYSDIS